MPFAADCETPYSLTSHFAVAGSISVMLIRSPCFLQNSSNDLSVTNVSTSLSWPAEILLCIWATVTPSRSAARSHVYPSAPLTRAAVTRSRVEGAKDGRFRSQNAARELADMRGSRTFNRPLPMKYLSREGRTRNIFHSARSDHASVTLALIPSAAIRKRTARTERSRRWAILLTGSYPARFNNLSPSAGVHGLQAGRRAAAASSDAVALAGWRSSRAARLAALRNSLMRCQQSPRVHSGTSSRTRLIASRFLADPSLIPAINS